MTTQLCPCGSTQNYADCCARYVDHQEAAPTPVLLMRARYTAFTLGKIDFIKSTLHGTAKRQFDEQAAKDWAAEATWLGLNILNASPVAENDSVGYVEFIADCEEHGKKYHAHERSRFEKIKGLWYYTDGIAMNEPEEHEHVHTDQCRHDHHHEPARSQKVGRNDPCPCGSGQKYKKCCGVAH